MLALLVLSLFTPHLRFHCGLSGVLLSPYGRSPPIQIKAAQCRNSPMIELESKPSVLIEMDPHGLQGWNSIHDCEKDEDKEALLPNASSPISKRSSYLRRNGSMIMNAVSLVVILGLLFHISSISKSHRKHCLERFNAYCKFLQTTSL